jgi:hypothetical protein
MNDEHDADRDDATPDPDLDAGQDARIRALLAELGSGPDGEPIPAEVEARLDDTLAMLVAERGRAGGAGPDDHQDESAADNVVPLRRRWLPRAAVAAAAVIVLGAGGVFVANLGQMSPTGQNSASDSAGESKAEAPESAGGSSSDSESGSDSDSGSGTGAAALPELSAATFANDVAILLEGRASLLTPKGEAADEQSPRKNRDNAKPVPPGALASQACPGPEITDGAVPNRVLYDGQPAVLLLHPERAGRQVVEAWNCAGDRKLASTTITK